MIKKSDILQMIIKEPRKDLKIYYINKKNKPSEILLPNLAITPSINLLYCNFYLIDEITFYISLIRKVRNLTKEEKEIGYIFFDYFLNNIKEYNDYLFDKSYYINRYQDNIKIQNIINLWKKYSEYIYFHGGFKYYMKCNYKNLVYMDDYILCYEIDNSEVLLNSVEFEIQQINLIPQIYFV